MRNRTGKPIFFEVNPEYIRNPEVIENLGRLQGDELAFGLQSTDPDTLRTIQRKFHRDVYERNVRRLRELNPKANFKFSLIVGLPGDTLDKFLGSLDFVISLRPADVYVHDLLVLPGSEIFEDPERFGIAYDESPPHGLLSHATFSEAERRQAKRLGFWVKVLHNLPDVSSALHDLAVRQGRRFVDTYADFAAWLGDAGVEPMDGRRADEVSSEQFDPWRDRFLADEARVEAVRQVLADFKVHLDAGRLAMSAK